MKLARGGFDLGRFALSSIAAVAVVALLTTAVAFAAPPTKTHPPVDHPTAGATIHDEGDPAEAETSQEPEADDGQGACSALNGNAPQVIGELVANWPTKHDKGDKTKDIPAGLQKVAERLQACQQSSANVGASPKPVVPDDKNSKPGKKPGKSKDR